MLSTPEVQEALEPYTCVEWLYDGLGGSVIRWTHEHGSDHEDPGVLAWILDPDGNVIASGQEGGVLSGTSGLVKWLEEHAKSSFPVFDPSSYDVLQREAALVAGKRKLGKTLSDLRELAAGGDKVEAAEQEEATRILAEITPFLDWQFERAEKLVAANPPKALAAFDQLAKDLKGDELGDKAKDRSKELKKSKAFKEELKAWGLLEAVNAMQEDMRPCGKRTLDLKSCDKCREKNASEMRKAAGVLQTILKRHPDTAAAREATKTLADWSLR